MFGEWIVGYRVLWSHLEALQTVHDKHPASGIQKTTTKRQNLKESSLNFQNFQKYLTPSERLNNQMTIREPQLQWASLHLE